MLMILRLGNVIHDIASCRSSFVVRRQQIVGQNEVGRVFRSPPVNRLTVRTTCVILPGAHLHETGGTVLVRYHDRCGSPSAERVVFRVVHDHGIVTRSFGGRWWRRRRQCCDRCRRRSRWRRKIRRRTRGGRRGRVRSLVGAARFARRPLVLRSAVPLTGPGRRRPFRHVGRQIVVIEHVHVMHAVGHLLRRCSGSEKDRGPRRLDRDHRSYGRLLRGRRQWRRRRGCWVQRVHRMRERFMWLHVVITTRQHPDGVLEEGRERR